MFCQGCNYFLAASKTSLFCGVGKDCNTINKEKECLDKIEKSPEIIKLEHCSKYEFYTKNNIEQVPKTLRNYLLDNPACSLLYYSVNRSSKSLNYKIMKVTIAVKDCNINRWEMQEMFKDRIPHTASCYSSRDEDVDVSVFNVWWHTYIKQEYAHKQKRRHRHLSY